MEDFRLADALDELNITDIDSEIEKVSQLTDRLLAKPKENTAKESPQSILPATAKFVKTACQAVAPATKTILIAVSNASSSVIS
jgi:hypothetical protein